MVAGLHQTVIPCHTHAQVLPRATDGDDEAVETGLRVLCECLAYAPEMVWYAREARVHGR